MQVGVLGVVDWHEMLDTSSPAYTSVASVVLERTVGRDRGEGRHRLHPGHRVHLGLRRPAGRLPRAVRRRARRGLLPVLRAAAPAAGVPDRRAADDGRGHRGRVRDRPADLDPGADPAADGGDGAGPGARPDPRAHRAAPPPADAAPAVPDVALPAAQHRRRARLDRDLRVRRQERPRPAPDRAVAAVDRRRRRRVRALGAREASGRSGPRQIHEHYLHADPLLLDFDEEDLANTAVTGGGPRGGSKRS